MVELRAPAGAKRIVLEAVDPLRQDRLERAAEDDRERHTTGGRPAGVSCARSDELELEGAGAFADAERLAETRTSRA